MSIMLIVVSGTQKKTTRDYPGVEDTLRDLWSTRPRRPHRGRKIAGVAAGIAQRYHLDPILVRVAFVVSAFYGGAGIVMYLLGWLLLPEQDDESSPLESLVSRGKSSTSAVFTILLCAALFPAMAWLTDGAAGAIGLLLLATALFLLHRSRGHLPPLDTSTAQAPPPVENTPSTALDSTAERTEPEPPPQKHRSKVSAVTLGAALVVGATCVLAQPYVSWLTWLTPGHIVGIVLGVLGIGMVVGSFAHGGRGLIALAVPLAVIGVVFTASAWDGRFHNVGEIIERPTAVEAVQPVYTRSMGRVGLDLTGLPTTEGLPPIRVEVNTGEAIVVLPRTADVELTCESRTGHMECLGYERSGFGSKLEITDYGSDGAGGTKIKLDVRSEMGNVQVHRG